MDSEKDHGRLFMQAASDSGALKYYLTVDPLFGIGMDKPYLENYGVMVVHDRNSRAEAQSVRGITLKYDAIKELISVLCDNHVTPDSLEYIVEDWLLT